MSILVLKRQRPRRVGVKATPPNPFKVRPNRVLVQRNRNAARRIAAQKKLNRERVDSEQRWEANKTTRTPELDAQSAARLAREPDKYAEKQPNNKRFRVSWTDKLRGPNRVNIQPGRPSLSGRGPRPGDVDDLDELQD